MISVSVSDRSCDPDKNKHQTGEKYRRGRYRIPLQRNGDWGVDSSKFEFDTRNYKIGVISIP